MKYSLWIVGGTKKRCKDWDAVNPIFAERDGGDASLRTGSSAEGIGLTLDALMREEDSGTDDEGRSPDNIDDPFGLSYGESGPSETALETALPSTAQTPTPSLSSSNPSIREVGSGEHQAQHCPPGS